MLFSKNKIDILQICPLVMHSCCLIEGELPIISVRVNLPNKYCQYKIPVLSSVWCHLGFSFEDTNALSVYRNGILVDTSGSQSCTNYVSVIPASAVLRAGSPTQAAAFQLDELVIWNKWLEQKNFIYRYQYASSKCHVQSEIFFVR